MTRPGTPTSGPRASSLLALSYRFEPGEATDGVTAQVPLAVINQVDPDGFDWQVPGYRTELVTELVRTLPKAVRRQLGPLAEISEQAAERVHRRVRRLAGVPPHRLVDVMAVELTDLSGVTVSAGDFDVRALPPHLRMGFAALDGEQVVAIGKDLDAVRDLVGGRVRAAIAEAAPSIERSGITSWDFGDLPRAVATTTGALPVQGYPALLDEGDAVAIRLFSRPEIAERVMPAGVRRLILLSVPVGIKGLAGGVPNRVHLAIGAVEGLTLGLLLRDVIKAAADEVLAAHGGAVWEADQFTDLVDAARRELRPAATSALRRAGDVLVAAAGLAATLDRLVAPALGKSVADARSHLARLVRPGFVASAGTARLDDVARYVEGIDHRLSRVAADPRRDRRRMAEVAAVEQDYRKLLAALRPSQVTRRVVEAGWMLEELRINTFAQSLGTKGPVSAKRITTELDRLFAGDLD